MSKKPIESFFDDNSPSFKFWQSPNGIYKIDINDIIFQGPLIKFCKKRQTIQERYFILTEKYLFYLATPNTPNFIAIMPVQWIRVDYLISESEKTPAFCFRFLRNKKYTDLFTTDKESFDEWKEQFSKVFWQCDFQSKFEPLKELGKGSFAKVYLVKNISNGKEFAVKAFSKKPSPTLTNRRQSLINEIEILKQLKHENILKLEELHESRNSIYLVLELLKGGELLTVLTNPDMLTEIAQKQIMKALFKALAYMEEKMIMHRDIKPTNIIIKEKNCQDYSQIKLVDFGLATCQSNPNPLYKRCGTPGFIAPEVLNCTSKESIPYSMTCDVFSAGIIFYIMLCGRSPFEENDENKILEMNKKCKINMFYPKLHKNPKAYDLLFKLLEKNPDDRITASEVLKHEYFDGIEGTQKPENDQEIEMKSSSNKGSVMKIYLENYKNKSYVNNLKNEFGSLGVQMNTIRGTMKTFEDSLNSQDAIFSLQSMGVNKKKENQEVKHSLLKTALLNNSTQYLDDIYQLGFAEENFNSEEEN